MFYIYFVKSLKNKKIYTGFSEKHPTERLSEHNYGSTKWARENRLFSMIYFEEYACKTDARKRENFYKTGIGRKIRNAIINVMNNKDV